MSVVPVIIFTIAAIAASYAIWSNLRSALPAIMSLRHQLAEMPSVHCIHMNTLDPRFDSAAANKTAAHRQRRRVLRPKPVTHRLHHYPRPAHVA